MNITFIFVFKFSLLANMVLTFICVFQVCSVEFILSLKVTEMHSEKIWNKCNRCEYISPYPSVLRTHLRAHNGERSFKCNQCDFTCSGPSSLRSHIKRHSGEKSKSAISVTIHLLMQAIWGSISEFTVEKNQINATSVAMYPFMQAIWGHIWKLTVEIS